MNILLRDYMPGDEGFYVHIWNEALKTCTWYRQHGPLTLNNAKKIIESKKKNTTYKLIFAIVQNKPVGFIECTMENNVTGFIFPYRPCILPNFRRLKLHISLIKAAVEHLKSNGARTVKFSIMGTYDDVNPYISFYRDLGFKIYRRAYIMGKSLDDVPSFCTKLLLNFQTAKSLGIDAFVNFFIECFRDSKDKDASQIAADVEKAKNFIHQLVEREGRNHDPDGWIAAFLEEKFVGFAIAIQQNTDGLIAEVGVVPAFRRRGIGTSLTIKALQRLKERGFKRVFLGVDVQNLPAIMLYKKLGFKKLPQEMFEMQKRII